MTSERLPALLEEIDAFVARELAPLAGVVHRVLEGEVAFDERVELA